MLSSTDSDLGTEGYRGLAMERASTGSTGSATSRSIARQTSSGLICRPSTRPRAPHHEPRDPATLQSQNVPSYSAAAGVAKLADERLRVEEVRRAAQILAVLADGTEQLVRNLGRWRRMTHFCSREGDHPRAVPAQSCSGGPGGQPWMPSERRRRRAGRRPARQSAVVSVVVLEPMARATARVIPRERLSPGWSP